MRRKSPLRFAHIFAHPVRRPTERPTNERYVVQSFRASETLTSLPARLQFQLLLEQTGSLSAFTPVQVTKMLLPCLPLLALECRRGRCSCKRHSRGGGGDRAQPARNGTVTQRSVNRNGGRGRCGHRRRGIVGIPVGPSELQRRRFKPTFLARQRLRDAA